MEYIDVLLQTPLFNGMTAEDIKCAIESVGARSVEYARNQTIIKQGANNSEIGIVLGGQGRSVIESAAGKTIIVALLGKGSFIGLLLAVGRNRASPVTVQAIEPMTVLFLPFEGLMKQYNELLLRNCFDCLSQKAMELYDRIDCLIRPSVREKVLAYLEKLADESGSRVFTTVLDRNAMAEYINVERSALSRELSRMKRDGLIDYYKNSFKLL